MPRMTFFNIFWGVFLHALQRAVKVDVDSEWLPIWSKFRLIRYVSTKGGILKAPSKDRLISKMEAFEIEYSKTPGALFKTRFSHIRNKVEKVTFFIFLFLFF